MLISQIPNQRMTDSKHATLTLRDGQIVQGKINKIYPNNRAEVQIGTHRFIAEIKSPLEVGGRYIFQVGAKNESLIQLQVISEQISGVRPDQLASLLRQLHIKVNDTTLAFAQSLINERIPFSQRDLVQALQLMDRVGNSTEIQSIIKQMMQQKLPIQENILRAFLLVNQQNMSQTLTNALNELNTLQPSPTTQTLQSLMSNLVQPLATEQQTSLPESQVRQLVQTLQLLNYLPAQTEQRVESIVDRLLQQGNNNRNVMPTLINELQANIRTEQQQNSMLQIVKQYRPLLQISSQLMNEFNLLQTQSLNEEQFTTLKNRITNDLLPLLPSHAQRVVNELLSTNQPNNLQQIQTLLQTFQSQQFYSVLMETMLMNSDDSTRTNDALIQQRFLLHVEQLLQTLGTSNEAIVKQLPPQLDVTSLPLMNAQQTIKALLLNVLQEERVPLENLQQLVHFINGLQLQTREENNLYQAHLQLPGEKLGLPEDLFIQFEGRKTKDDQIDTEFCRILFFLHLHHLKDTIIDMNIQKRVISLTVYNEFSEQLSVMMSPLKNNLSNGLEKLDYHLSNVRFKPLEEEESLPKRAKTDHQNVQQNKREGFDFFV